MSSAAARPGARDHVRGQARPGRRVAVELRLPGEAAARAAVAASTGACGEFVPGVYLATLASSDDAEGG